MEVEIQNEDTRAIIDPQGAWLTNLSDENGDILFPRRTLAGDDGESKLRGGCHVCLPNFGPGGSSGLAQHGFGRTMLWDVADKTESSVMLLRKHGEGDYEAMRSVLTYQLGDERLVAALELTNNGDTPLRVAPAFHPYFAFTSEDSVALDGVKMELAEPGETEFIDGGSHQLTTGRRQLQLESENLPVWAKWTDKLGKYVCVEPTLGGYTFLQGEPKQEELLQPKETKTYAFSITWG